MTPKISTTPVLLALLALVLWAGGGLASAQAQTGEGWAAMGALPSDAYSLAPDPANPSAMYALGAGGISHSTDRGATWSVCNRDARGMRVVVHDDGRSTVVRLYATGPSGLRQSTDGCATWKDVPTQAIAPSNADIRWIATYPDNDAVLYAGMDGLGGLYRSTDTGSNWQPASQGLPRGAWATALTADPRHPERVFAGLRYATRDHPPAYVYRSTDGGLTWRSASLGLHLLP